MQLFALAVFAIHTLFELVFGASALMSGASSSATAEQIAAQTVQTTIAFRFMGAALFALGVLGLVVLFDAGVRSVTARYVAMGLAAFHLIGASASFLTAYPDNLSIYASTLSLGALIVHGSLGLGFAVIAMTWPRHA